MPKLVNCTGLPQRTEGSAFAFDDRSDVNRPLMFTALLLTMLLFEIKMFGAFDLLLVSPPARPTLLDMYDLGTGVYF